MTVLLPPYRDEPCSEPAGAAFQSFRPELGGEQAVRGRRRAKAFDNSPDSSRAPALRVLATCRAFEPGFRAGGPIRSLAVITATLPPAVAFMLVTSDRDLGAAEPYPGMSGRWIDRGRARIFYLNHRSAGQWARLLRELLASRFDVLYVNSLWDPLFSVVPVLGFRLGLLRADTVVLAPRGELDPGALSQKAAKKRALLPLFRLILRGKAVTWHATSTLEQENVLRVFPRAATIVHEEQTLLPSKALAVADSGDVARFVFIGRIAPKKNLHLSLEALRDVSAPAVFDVYGPIEDESYWAHCQSIIRTLPSTTDVRYRGLAHPQEVRQVFASYDAFLFPTLGENFAHVIAESLSASCPVVCSELTPWTDTLRRGGGWVVDTLTATALADQLQRIASSPAGARTVSRRRAGLCYEEWHLDRHAQPHLFAALMDRLSSS
jgi:glycosyltransferase involved in cell wall biosynthesis